MELWLWFLILSFANYRLALMLSGEEGPFRLFERFRNLFTEPNWIGRGVRCFLCISFWTSFLLMAVLALIVSLHWSMFILLSLGVSGLAVFMYETRWRR